MKKVSIFVRIILSFFIIAIVPTFFFGSLIILSYGNLIEKNLSYIREKGITIDESFFSELTKVQGGIKYQILLTFFLALILIGFSFVMIYKDIVLPIKELIKITKEVTAGNLNIQIKTEKKDEIGELMSSFNQMMKDLKSSRELLEEEKRTLEVKVRSRTKELEELTKNLDKKVKRRTKELEKSREELQERLGQLEKFQKVTVGRELKMIELKERIREQEKQLKSSLRKK